jgi:hypothetical protein
MRYRLRTLLIVMLVAGPLCAWAWKLWTWREWQRYREAREAVEMRNAEWKMAKAISNGSRRAKAGERHAELRYKREDALARENSVLYGVLTPAP